jgi:hypothetical protein
MMAIGEGNYPGFLMSINYDALSGAQGRSQLFRLKRHDGPGLFLGAPPVLEFDDQSFLIRNISGSGIGAVSASGEPTGGLDRLNKTGVLRLSQSGEEIFRAAARYVRVHHNSKEVFVGFALEGARFDLDDLKIKNAVAMSKARPVAFGASPVPRDYKIFCADVLDFVSAYVDNLSKSVGMIESALAPSKKLEIFNYLYDEIKKPWADILFAGNELVIPHHDDREMRKALKTYTERSITKALVDGPTWRRSHDKPLGYPGDFQLMNYMYDEQPEGGTIKAMFLHALGLVAGRPIVSRMYSLAELMVEWYAEHKEGPFRVTSIGSGPAREFEQIARLAPIDSRWEVTLVDQEPAALEFALSSNPALTGDGRFAARGLNSSFAQMLNPSQSIVHLPQQDVIYSLGLVDYLSLPLASRFARRMLDYVRPGGRLVIANVNNLPTGITWQAEHVSDWTLYFRSRHEMLMIAQGAPEAEVKIVEDSIKSVYFLIMRKPLE